MKITHNSMPGVVEITPEIHLDRRGYFTVPFSKEQFKSNQLPYEFVQDNESFSKRGTLRGLHYQKNPFAQGKLVRVIQGIVQDVVVDLRAGSPTYKEWRSFFISRQSGNMLYVPPGFAHGFLALEDSIFSYKCTATYNKDSEGGIYWDDKELGIKWNLMCESEFIISEKDEQLPSLESYVDNPCFIF